MRRRFSLVFNQRAGTIRPLMLDRVLTVLRANGASVEPVTANSAEEATAKVRALALARSVDAVIAAGGDGTIRAVAAGVGDLGMPVGIIPLGTGNVMKYEIALPRQPKALAETLLSGDVVTARCGLVNGAPFFLMVGAGFDGRVVAGLNHRLKRLVGRAAFSVPALSALARGPDRFTVEIDGERCEASWLIVSNARHYGGSFVLTPDTQVGADRLIAVAVTGNSRAALLAAGLALASGRLGDGARCPRGVLVKPASHVRIEATPPVHLEVDGDEAGFSPAEISAAGPHVAFIVPPSYAKGLTKRHTNHLASAA